MPESADRWMFTLMPIVALAATVTAFLYIPIWGRRRLFASTATSSSCSTS